MSEIDAQRTQEVEADRRAGQARTVAFFTNYQEAEAAVDRLADRGFPVQMLSIVARDLRFVEQVTGRVTYARAGLAGAGSGLAAGLLLGFLLGLFNVVQPIVTGLVLALYGAAIGAVLGATIGLLGHAAGGGRRDFSSVSGVRAGHYDVVADVRVAERAAALLQDETTPRAAAADA